MTYRSPEPEELHWDLIPWAGLRRLARRYAVGSKMRADRGEDPRLWESGLEWASTFRHIMWHLWRYNAIRMSWIQDDGDDHLAAAAWGCFAQMHFEEMEELFVGPRQPEDPGYGRSIPLTELSAELESLERDCKTKPIEEVLGEYIRKHKAPAKRRKP